jgi:flavin reductase (DIM6/NTAB) family NADH-FMN oxidoreductase RutF
MGDRGELDTGAKRAVLRMFSYGLYAVSAEHQGERGIFTANWLSQVSFDPPLVMVSIERESATLPLIRDSGRFAVALFAGDQRELAGDLGRPRARTGDKFSAYDLEVLNTAQGEPVLASALGYLVCQIESETSAGDSIVIIGEVIEAGLLNAGEPLTMKAAGFRHAG